MKTALTVACFFWKSSWQAVSLRSALTTLLLAPLAALHAADAPANKASTRRPNLVFVFSDQQSWDTLGCYGNTQTHTPNLDQLAAKGVRFASCFSSDPVCAPMRAMLMTGLHPLKNGVVRNDWQVIPENGPTFASVLRDAGYRTGLIGKWHLYGGNRNRPIPPGPHRLGFDHVFLSDNCSLDFGPEEAFYWEGNQKVKFGKWQHFGQTDQAVEFINGSRPEEPFALFVAWHPPHNHGGSGPEDFFGYAAPKEYLDRYHPDKIQLRPDQPDDARHRKMTCGYYALVDSIDACFGRIEQALAQRGLTDNTVVVFTSDHGDLLRYVKGQRQDKSRPEPASCQVPLLIRYPVRLEPRRSDLMVGTLDLMPTLLGLMELPVPANCDGRNLSQAMLVKDDSASTEVPLFSFLGGPYGWRGVVTRQHLYSTQFGTYAKPYPVGFELLIDRINDPYAVRNLRDTPAAQEVQKDLHERTIRWAKKFGDQVWSQADLERASAKDLKGFRKQSGELKGRPIDMIMESGAQGLLR